MTKRKRRHTLFLTVTFDRACTRSHARQEAADCIHGTFYPTQRDLARDPGEFVVRAVASRPPKAARK